MLMQMKEKIKYYLANSSIHGLKYIADSKRHWTERVFWEGAVLLACYGLCLQLFRSYGTFLNSPVSFLVDGDRLHWNSSFPAVSVCEADADIGAITPSANRLFGEDHDLDLDTFLRDIVFFDGNCYACESLCGISINCTEDFQYLTEQVRQPCEKLLKDCRWMERGIDCCEVFQPLQTETGLCYTLNSKHTTGQKDNTKFLLNKETGPGKLKFKVTKDVNIYIHTTEDVPYINIPQEDKTFIALGANFKMSFVVMEIENDPGLVSIPVGQRKCIFADEKSYSMYGHYSYSACVVDCRAEAQRRLCNCTHHLMPRAAGTKICDIQGLICLSKNSKIIGSLRSPESNKPGLVCPCFPSCTEHDHEVVESILTPSEDAKSTTIEIDMKSLPLARFRRYIVRTKLDLVVTLGGTAGLFLGVSILSLAELFYILFMHRLPNHNLLLAQNTLGIPTQYENKLKRLKARDNKSKDKHKTYVTQYLP